LFKIKIKLYLPKKSNFMEKVKIAVIIPDRGDRPEFLEHLKFMLESQTVKPDFVLVADWKATSDECDITERYREAYKIISEIECFDLIMFMENDDFYHVKYIETMLNEWLNNGRPDIIGTAYTIYYHIGLLKYFTMEHYERASMMNTCIKPNLKINWTADNDPYTDMCLWKQLKGHVFKPEFTISVGIKHNVGLSGGHFHGDKLHRYVNDDREMYFLKGLTNCQKSIEFYKNQHEKLHSSFK
jgi:hypothetical protein